MCVRASYYGSYRLQIAERGAMSCEQGAMSLEQGALSGEQGALSGEQGAGNVCNFIDYTQQNSIFSLFLLRI